MSCFERARAALLLCFVAASLAACKSSAQQSPTAPPAGGGPVQAATVVAQGNNTFSPSNVNLLAGGTVTFVNNGGLHNVNASGAMGFRCAEGCDGDGAGGNGDPSETGWSFMVTFPSPGTTNYVCDEHASVGMAGSIVVQ